MHPYVEFIRYHHYMYGLTGNEGKAERRANLVLKQVREVFTPGGPGYVWDHRFLPDADAPLLACPLLVYLQFTFQTFQDLALEGMEGSSHDCFYATCSDQHDRTGNEDGYQRFAPDICGGTF